LLKSKHFVDFFNQSTKVLEKMLDGRDGDMLELLLQDDMKTGNDFSKDILNPTVKFFDANYTKNRVVTSVDWSPQIPELVLASYSQNEEGNIKDHVGVLLLWSLSLRTRPEFHCFCQSQITSACFYPYSNNTIIGGCYNGQLLLWDLRTKSLPVQRTGLSSNGHKYPVYSLNVVGTQIANNVVSISNDGKLCMWDIKSLGSPIKAAKLENKTEINVTCAEFP
jgi:dynein intermediate chain